LPSGENDYGVQFSFFWSIWIFFDFFFFCMWASTTFQSIHIVVLLNTSTTKFREFKVLMMSCSIKPELNVLLFYNYLTKYRLKSFKLPVLLITLSIHILIYFFELFLYLSRYSSITLFQYELYDFWPKSESGVSGVPGCFSILDRR